MRSPVKTYWPELRVSNEREVPSWLIELIAWPVAFGVVWGLWRAAVWLVIG